MHIIVSRMYCLRVCPTGFDCVQNGLSVPQLCSKELSQLENGEFTFPQVECMGVAFVISTFNSLFLLVGSFSLTEKNVASPQEIDQLRSALVKNGLPTSPCCDIAKKFNTAKCQCDAGLNTLITQVGIDMNAIISILDVMAQSCTGPNNFTVSQCS